LFYLIDWLKNCKKNIILLIGEAFRYRNKLKELKLPENFKILPYNPIYLLEGDIAIATFGVTIYELVYLNIPTLCAGHTKENATGCEILSKRCEMVKSMGYFKDIKTEDIIKSIN